MRCIFCCEDRAPSLEHVFPSAIGGTLTTDRVCARCNSDLGSRVDAALCDFLPVRSRRGKLGLAGNSKTPPPWYEMFLGQATLVGEDGGRIQTSYNPETGKLDHRRLYQARDKVLPDGQKIRQITIDLRDADQIATIIQRERKRHNLPPLSAEELAIAAQNVTVETVEQPLIQKSLQASFAYLQHAVLKIGYELAFLWLGDAYLEDPRAVELRSAILSKDLAAADAYAASTYDAKDCHAFSNYWLPHEAHHLAYGTVLPGQVVVALRIFDLYASAIVVSHAPERYFQAYEDEEKLKFLAIDAVSGRTIQVPFAEERHRLAQMMTAARCTPPFADPLSIT